MEDSLRTVVGIDVAKAKVDVATDPPTRTLTFPNNASGFHALASAVRPLDVGLVVVEATGGYERALVAALRAEGFAVAVINGARIRHFANASGILAKTDAIDARVIAEFGRRMQPRPGEPRSEAVEAIDQLIVRRRQLVGMRTMEMNREQQATATLALKQIRQLIKVLDRQIAQVDEEIGETIDGDPTLKEKVDILRSVPGVGDVTARTLLAELSELGDASRQEIGALTGVAPYDRSSGPSNRKRSIRGGRTGARTVGYMAAFSAMRCNPVIRAFAERLKAKGKPHKVVVVACIRKLFTILNALLKRGEKWNPDHFKIST